MKLMISVLMVLHGIAHAVGFATSWKLANPSGFKTTVFGGTVDLGEFGIRVTGIMWLITGAAFVVIAVAWFTEQQWWTSLAWITLVVSTLLTIVEWPEARIGLAVNALLAIALLAYVKFLGPTA
jgi:hypothetical protein